MSGIDELAPPEGLDELFGGGGGAPEVQSAPIIRLLLAGLVTTLLGLACTTAPGGVLVLLAWMRVEKEADRVQNGFLPESARPQVERLRSATYAGLLFVVAMFVVQGALLCTGFYEGLLVAALPYWREVVRVVLTLLGAPPPEA